MEIHSLGRYQVRARLGRGTMGIVYRGYDPVLEREIALKTVDLSPALSEENRKSFLTRFFQEARIAAKLLHPNIVVTHDASTDPGTGTPFIAMELVPGESLFERMERSGKMGWQEASRLIVLLARALDYAHREKVVHRDMKPANVLLSPEGVPKIADFGIAKLSDAHLTQTGSVIGTPHYMSPEQLEARKVDGRSDLFSLGSLFYAAMVGHPPFRGNDLATVTRQILNKSPDPPSDLVSGIPESIDGVIGRVLAKEPEERYATGSELAEDLERVLRGERPLRPLSLGEKTLETKRPSIEQRFGFELDAEESPSSRRGIFFWLLAAGALGFAGITYWDRLERSVRDHREIAEQKEALAARAKELRAEARRGRDRGRWDEALTAVEESLALSQKGGDGGAEAEALLLRGLIRADTGEWSGARADLDSAASVFEIYDLPGGRARAILELANLERDLGSFEKARRLYDDAERDPVLRLEVQSERALLDLMREDFESAERGFRSVYESGAGEEARSRAGAVLALLEGDVKVSAEPLEAIFLGEQRTKRRDERQKRLTAAISPP